MSRAAYVWHKHRRDLATLRRQLYNYSKGHVAYQLTTLLRDRDRRALNGLAIRLPQTYIERIKERLLGRSDYPLSLILLEIAGNLAGPWSLWRSRRRVRRAGRSIALYSGVAALGHSEQAPWIGAHRSITAGRYASGPCGRPTFMTIPGEICMNVSVIIPAYNAAGTIAETLTSLRAQTYEGWEAIVVDDGSSDETAAIVQGIAQQDPRIRIVNQARMGVSAARNRGISLARFNWVLFLDADDWLLPLHLERMTRALIADPDLDAVHCGWARVAPDGTRVGEKYWPQSGDLFPVFARLCPFAIHACIVRRSLVEAVGGFDTSLRTCEDWDLWQRIARAGARFGAIREILALYRMRPGSASSDGARFLADGLRVITQGHSPDPRVSNPQPAHADGLPAEQLPSVRLHFASWPAGLVLGRGDDARPLLALLR